MHISLALVKWYFRLALATTILVAATTFLYCMFYSGSLTDMPILAWVFIFLHTAVLALLMTGHNSPASAFLYTRGFTRDQLWMSRVVAHLLCVVTALAPATLVVWLDIRSAFQDVVMQSANYPVFAAADYPVPVFWLIGYLLLMGCAFYAPVRDAQPTRDRSVGNALAVGMLIAGSVFVGMPFRSTLEVTLAWGSVTLFSIALLVGSWLLHRKVEVNP